MDLRFFTTCVLVIKILICIIIYTVTDSTGAVKTSAARTLTVTPAKFSDPQLANNLPDWMPESPADLNNYQVTYLSAVETGIAYIVTDDTNDTVTVYPKPGYANTLTLWEITLDGNGPAPPGNGPARPLSWRSMIRPIRWPCARRRATQTTLPSTKSSWTNEHLHRPPRRLRGQP